jgi:hypothetical protein
VAPLRLATSQTPLEARTDVDARFAEARQQMADVIAGDCQRDIGGDEQRLLMPLWITTYVASGRTFYEYVNANTGKVIGEPPYSPVKVVPAVLVALAVVVGAFMAYRHHLR